jgi:hypothetical protein
VGEVEEGSREDAAREETREEKVLVRVFAGDEGRGDVESELYRKLEGEEGQLRGEFWCEVCNEFCMIYRGELFCTEIGIEFCVDCRGELLCMEIVPEFCKDGRGELLCTEFGMIFCND